MAIEAVQEKTKSYSCECGYVYLIGNCGEAWKIGKCPNCKKDIGGLRHVNINKAIDIK